MLQKNSVNNKEIWNIAYPIAFGGLAQTIVSITDTIFLGQVSSVALGASMMAGIYYYIWATLAWGFAIGLQIIIARRVGEGRLERVGVIFQHGLLVVSFLAVILLVLMHFLTEPILNYVVQSPNILNASLEYMKYRYFGIFFVSFNFLFRYFYVGLSTTKVIIYSTLIMAVVNIFFDYVLIFGELGFPEMGISGGALASVIAEVSAMVYFIIYTSFCVPLKRYAMTKIHKIEPWLIGAIFKLATPTMAQKIFSFGTWFLFFVFVEHMGELQIAVSGVIRSLYMLLGVPIFAFGATANTIVSRLMGAGKVDEIMPTLLRIVKISGFSLAPIIAVCCIFPAQVISMYSSDPQIIELSINVLYVLCLAVAVMFVAIIYFEAISGTGNTLHALIVEIGVLILYAFSIWFLVRILMVDVAGAWIVEIVYSVAMALFSILYLRYYPWQKKVI